MNYPSTDRPATGGNIIPPLNREQQFPGPAPVVREDIATILKLNTAATAVKYDQEKADWSMMPWDSVEEILKVLEFGKRKYSAWNWAQGDGFKYSRIFNSLMRHMFAWFRGEDNDPESGLSHLAHAGCNILFLIYFVKHKNKYKNNDDRV